MLRLTIQTTDSLAVCLVGAGAELPRFELALLPELLAHRGLALGRRLTRTTQKAHTQRARDEDPVEHAQQLGKVGTSTRTNSASSLPEVLGVSGRCATGFAAASCAAAPGYIDDPDSRPPPVRLA
jgi:hypothetical protein